MWLTSSSIGRKLVMSLTGAFLILFVTFHVLMNGVALFWPDAYNMVCEFLGANWYALIGSAVLALGFILHIFYAFWLTIQNRRARGSERYEVTSRPPQVEWSSKNMLVLGIVILAFLVIHLIQFWAKMQFAEIFHIDVQDCATGQSVPPAAGTWFLQIAFSQWYTLPVYLIGFVALWLHMTHGFWSMFHTCGWDNDIWIGRLKCIGNTWATIVVALFVAEAIVFTVQAHRGTYTSCPKLIEQYQEMAAAHGSCTTPCISECPEAACANECDKACTEACACNCPCPEACEGKCEGKCEGECCEACKEACKCNEACEGKCNKECEGRCTQEVAAAEAYANQEISND